MQGFWILDLPYEFPLVYCYILGYSFYFRKVGWALPTISRVHLTKKTRECESPRPLVGG
jgi:hypothetical protein